MVQNKTWIMLTVILFSVGFVGCHQENQKSILSEKPNVEVSNIKQTSDFGEGKIYVYVSGAVKTPGVYQLEKEARVYQAVELAGGMTKKAQKNSVNLADKMTDGQMIYIPEKSRKQDKEEVSESGNISGDTSNELIHINTAGIDELMKLTGIGETKAKAIIAYREENGNFSSPEQIKNVSGIGDATYDNIKSHITVN